jgi:MFS family permease
MQRRHLGRAITPVASLLFGVTILLAGQGLQSVLLPVRASLENLSAPAVGFIGAAYFLGFTLGCWHGGRFVRRVGHVRVFAAMTAAASASPLLHGLWINVWSWTALRLISGFCFAVLYVVIESWINEKSSNETRGSVFAVYIFINMTVLAAGQQILLLDEPSQMTLFAVSSILVSLAAVPVALSRSPTPEQPGIVRLDIRYLYKNSPAGMVGCLASGLANGAFWALAPLFTAAYSSDVSFAALFMTAAVLGGAVGQWPLGHLSDKVDRRYVMLGVAMLAAAAATVLWLLASRLGAGGVALLGALWGAFAFPLYSIAAAHANDYARPEEYVMVSGGLLLMYGVGAVIGPLAASVTMALLGGGGLYVFAAGVYLLLIVYVAFRALRRSTVPPDQQISFADALASAHTASQVYEEEIV